LRHEKRSLSYQECCLYHSVIFVQSTLYWNYLLYADNDCLSSLFEVLLTFSFKSNSLYWSFTSFSFIIPPPPLTSYPSSICTFSSTFFLLIRLFDIFSFYSTYSVFLLAISPTPFSLCGRLSHSGFPSPTSSYLIHLSFSLGLECTNLHSAIWTGGQGAFTILLCCRPISFPAQSIRGHSQFFRTSWLKVTASVTR
jgi:hypothetical protein